MLLWTTWLLSGQCVACPQRAESECSWCLMRGEAGTEEANPSNLEENSGLSQAWPLSPASCLTPIPARLPSSAFPELCVEQHPTRR